MMGGDNMAKGIRTDKFVSKPGDFQVVKPAPKSGNKTSGGSKSTGKKK